MITPLPTPPNTADSGNFDERADAFLSALPKFADEMNAYWQDLVKKGDLTTKTLYDSLNDVENESIKTFLQSLLDEKIQAFSANASFTQPPTSSSNATQDDELIRKEQFDEQLNDLQSQFESLKATKPTVSMSVSRNGSYTYVNTTVNGVTSNTISIYDSTGGGSSSGPTNNF